MANIEINRRKKKPGRDQIIGELIYHSDFYSSNLKNERDILVWLPPSYHHSNSRFPVLYMQDGQNLFSPHTSFIGYDWRVDETTTQLIKKKLVEEFIVVGICNTRDRLNEYNLFTPKGKLYSRFIIKELKIFIDETYRSKTGPGDTAVMGSSLGGLISFQLILNFPEVFGKAACMSNSFWVNNREIFESVKEKTIKREGLKIYLDCGCEEKELIEDNKKMCLLLRSIGFEQGKNLLCYFQRKGKHSELDWADRLNRPLKFLFNQ